MSFRLPRGPKLVTIFHDPHSAVSKRILVMLQARSQPVRVSNKAHDGRVAASARAPAQMYLDEAASTIEEEPLFELEVVDRARATHDQWRVIASYLKRAPRPSQVESLKDEVGPFVVAWDDGTVARTEAEADVLCKRLLDNNSSSSSGNDDRSKCTIV